MSKKVSEKTLKKSFLNWFFWNGCSQQAESMLGIAFAQSMSPAIDELYDTKEEKSAALHRHTTLFNTESQVGSICNGIAIGMEEQIANGESDAEMLNDTKVALIGPTSAIGDSLWVGTIIPLLLTICLSVSQALSAKWAGPLIYLLVYPAGTALLSWRLFKTGYKAGLDGVSQIMGSGKFNTIMTSITIVGLVAVGALTASNVVCPLNIDIKTLQTLYDASGNVSGEDMVSALNLDNLFNAVFPNIVPLALTLLVYRLYAKKQKSPVSIMGLILILAAILTALGYIPCIGAFWIP